MEKFRLSKQMPVWTRFSAPVQTDYGVHPALCINGTGFRFQEKSDQGVVLTPSN
jgi:hypothetical protein